MSLLAAIFPGRRRPARLTLPASVPDAPTLRFYPFAQWRTTCGRFRRLQMTTFSVSSSANSDFQPFCDQVDLAAAVPGCLGLAHVDLGETHRQRAPKLRETA